MIHDIPVCCKISLEGQAPPLHIKVTGALKSVSLNAYASYKVVEPSLSNSDQQWFEIRGQYMMRIQGERGNKPNLSIFNTGCTCIISFAHLLVSALQLLLVAKYRKSSPSLQKTSSKSLVVFSVLQNIFLGC